MAVGKAFFLSLILGTALVFGGCVQEEANGPQAGSAETGEVGLVKVIKNGKLVNYQKATIGNAFDSYRYLKNKEWKVEQLKSGHFTVDFVGWFDPDTLSDKDIGNGVTGRGLEIKFVIEPNGSFYVFMISVFEAKSDGKVYRNQLSDSAAILANIYANNKLNL